jgi:succinate dehydrogenase hydrophobic anchor subunit
MPWDGIERREVVQADAQSRRLPTQTVPPFVVVVTGVVIALLLGGILWALLTHAGRTKAETAKMEAFRNRLTCFVVGISQGRPGPDLLTTCGYLQTGGPP